MGLQQGSPDSLARTFVPPGDTMSDNPYLTDVPPGAWQVPLRRFGVGILVAAIIAGNGLATLRAGTAWVPVVQRNVGLFRPHRVSWVRAEGLAGRAFGMALVGAAIAIHARYFWRLRPRGWYHWELFHLPGVVIGVVSFVTAYALVLWQILA